MKMCSPPKKLCVYRDAKRFVAKIERDLHIAPKTLYNIEHIVPRKFCWSDIEWDMHNLFLMDARMNTIRDTRRLTHFQCGSARIRIDGELWCVHPFGFTPPPTFQGRYARGAAYALATMPESANLIARYVIDPKTLIDWHTNNPATCEEIECSRRKCSMQEQESNVVIEDPEFVPWLVHHVYATTYPGYSSFFRNDGDIDSSAS
jgi:hypothetical protein